VATTLERLVAFVLRALALLCDGIVKPVCKDAVALALGFVYDAHSRISGADGLREFDLNEYMSSGASGSNRTGQTRHLVAIALVKVLQSEGLPKLSSALRAHEESVLHPAEFVRAAANAEKAMEGWVERSIEGDTALRAAVRTAKEKLAYAREQLAEFCQRHLVPSPPEEEVDPPLIGRMRAFTSGIMRRAFSGSGEEICE